VNAAAETAVPIVDIGALFGPAGPLRSRTDSAIMAAACEVGFLTVTGVPPDVPQGPAARAELQRIFALPEPQQRPLWRQKFEPANANLYRGFFPPQPGNLTCKEGIDLGGDVLYGAAVVSPNDPLRERTPLPAEVALPGWHRAVAAYYAAMERVCAALMRAIARGLGLEERFFDAAFHQGLSTLRLIRYPARRTEELAACKDPGVWVMHDGERRYLCGAPHTDSGFITLLACDGVQGLQARLRDGRWCDVRVADGALGVNFGQVLERWSGGRIRATEHRVIGCGQERYSIPFFYEARAEAEIRPLPTDDPGSFEPFLYGDHLWARMTSFVEFQGMEGLRRPAGG
jgi:isopenicillin N synthase-like dioxygenase